MSLSYSSSRQAFLTSAAVLLFLWLLLAVDSFTTKERKGTFSTRRRTRMQR